MCNKSVREISFAALIKRSSQSLKGHYWKGLLLFCIAGAVNLAVNFIPIVQLLSGWLLFPLNVGMMLFYLRASRNEAAPVSSLFEPFRQYWRMLWGCLRVGIFVFLWALPGIALIGLFGYYVSQHNQHPAVWITLLFSALLIILLFLPISATYRYSMTYYIMLDAPAMSVRNAMQKSIELIYGYKLRLFGYTLLWGVLIISITLLLNLVAALTLFWLGILLSALLIIAIVPLLCAFGANFYLALLPEEPAEDAAAPATAVEADSGNPDDPEK